MALFKKLIVSAAVALFAVTVLPTSTALAQGASIVVYDQARVMRDTTGGQDITQKVGAIGQSMQTELKSEGDAVDTEAKALQTRTANLTQEAAAADPALRSQIESFARKRQSFAQKGQVRQAELQRTEQAAWAQFFQALQAVILEVATERSVDIVMERSSLAYSAVTLDVTDTIIAKMNTRAPSFTVTRARLQEQPATIQQ